MKRGPVHAVGDTHTPRSQGTSGLHQESHCHPPRGCPQASRPGKVHRALMTRGQGREAGKCLTPPPLLQRQAMAQSTSQQYSVPLFLLLFHHLVVSDSLQPHELRHARLPCPSPSPGVILLINPLENQGRMKKVIRTPNSYQGSTSVRRN